MASKSSSPATDAAPTSRATFRLLAKGVGATNREADTLRHALLAQWSEGGGVDALVEQLHEVGSSDEVEGERVDGLLAVWFSSSAPVDGRIVAIDDPVLTGLSAELGERLAGVASPTVD